MDTRGILNTPALGMRCSRTSESNNWQSDKKEISTNNQDKKHNSKKHLEGQQFLFTNMGTENPESRIKPCRFKP